MLSSCMRAIGGAAAAALCAVARPVLANPISAPAPLPTASEIEARIARQEAIKAVERLQFAFGYYQDRFFYDQVATLFAPDATMQLNDDVWVGSRGVKRFWTGYFGKVFAGGSKGPVAGKLLDLPQWQEVITVSDDGKTAVGRFRTIGRLAFHRDREFWISGVFLNKYVKQGDVWKIQSMRFCNSWASKFVDGWKDNTVDTAVSWLPPIPYAARPDRKASDAEVCPPRYPAGGETTFEFANPVTGKFD